MFNLEQFPSFDQPDKISYSDVYEREIVNFSIKFSKKDNNYTKKFTQYSHEIYRFLFHVEVAYAPVKDYIAINQPELNQFMRLELIDWMVAVAEQFKIRNDTLILSIGYIDRFLSNKCNGNLSMSYLQLTGVVAIFIASKIEEVIPPRIDDLLFVTENSYLREDIMVMEWQVLESLRYEITHPTSLSFLSRIVKGNKLLRSKEEVILSFFCSY